VRAEPEEVAVAGLTVEHKHYGHSTGRDVRAFTAKENLMTSAEDPARADLSPNGEDNVPEGGAGIGATTTDEPDTFEPEESPE
jgi:hypothetical protein